MHSGTSALAGAEQGLAEEPRGGRGWGGTFALMSAGVEMWAGRDILGGTGIATVVSFSWLFRRCGCFSTALSPASSSPASAEC